MKYPDKKYVKEENLDYVYADFWRLFFIVGHDIFVTYKDVRYFISCDLDDPEYERMLVQLDTDFETFETYTNRFEFVEKFKFPDGKNFYEVMEEMYFEYN